MATKEWLDARWKAVGGAVIAIAAAVLMVLLYDFLQGTLAQLNTANIPQSARDQLAGSLGSFDVYIWGQWFAKNGQLILAALAAFLGGGLIAGEVGKNTIYFLLAHPVSRERVLLTKWAVSAGVLALVALLGGLTLWLTAALDGHPQGLGGVLLSSGLLWLGVLSVLGVALLLSVLFNDVLRPVALTLVLVALAGLPSFFPHGADWSLPNYWASLPAYQGAAFPLKEVVVCLMAAALPFLGALGLFRTRAY
ncbi:MAG TPA: ABC transporter permease subunit, partial [Chloroflexia bacterium]|nr:ABC transporter permease subunit [Chloroflexia bacterium]